MATYLLNTSIVPTVGLWSVKTLNPRHVRGILFPVSRHGRPDFVSAIGHESTARVIETLLQPTSKWSPPAEVPVNRLTVEAEVGDRLICFKLKSRPPEGTILSQAQIQEIGFDWIEMELLAPSLEAYNAEREASRDEREAYEAQRQADRAECQERLGRRWHADTATEPRHFMGGHRD
jgi:hypothetical protein